MVGEPIQIPKPSIPIEQCDFHLGQYLRAFNIVEVELTALFAKLLDAPRQAAHIVFHSGINAQTLREIIIALARLRLTDDDYEHVKRLMNGPVKRAFTKRNRIVHGQWIVHLAMPHVRGERPVVKKATWQRLYMPSDPAVFKQMWGKSPNRKVLAAHMFSIEDLRAACTQTAQLGESIKKLTARLKLQPYTQPQPIF